MQQEDIELERPFTEEELKEKYEGKLEKEMRGPTFQLFWHPCCFLLLKGGLWIHLSTGEGHHVRLQAPNFVKFEDVQSVNFARYFAQ